MLASWSVAQTDSNTEKNRGQKSPWTVPLKGKKVHNRFLILCYPTMQRSKFLYSAKKLVSGLLRLPATLCLIYKDNQRFNVINHC